MISIDDDGVTRTLDDGTVESVRWDELAEVRIATTSDGPLAEDVFWLLIAGSGSGVALPSEFVDEHTLARFQALPGFDNEEFIKSMSSTDDAQFVVWRK